MPRTIKKRSTKKKVVAVSGGFDPVHVGHVRMFEKAKKLGDRLVVILNNDNWLKKKKGYVFMPEKERKELLEHIRWVDKVVLTKHRLGTKDMSVCDALKSVRPDIFANGGDRKLDNIPEVAVCEEIGCRMVFNVGHGGKVQSSSWLINNYFDKKKDIKKGVDNIGVTCVFFCHDGKGNLLMHKRSKNCRDEVGRWDCGSGSMEFGETPEQTARREIKEEYCAVPKGLTLCGVTNVLRRNDKRKTHWIAFIFAAKIDPRMAKIGEPEKMGEIGWFRTSKLPKPLHSMLLKHLNIAKKAGVKI